MLSEASHCKATPAILQREARWHLQVYESRSLQTHSPPFQLYAWGSRKKQSDPHLQRPTTDSACSWQMATVVVGDSARLTPAATACVASPASSPLCARWAATSEEEQAVSVLMQGPIRPNR